MDIPIDTQDTFTMTKHNNSTTYISRNISQTLTRKGSVTFTNSKGSLFSTNQKRNHSKNKSSDNSELDIYPKSINVDDYSMPMIKHHNNNYTMYNKLEKIKNVKKTINLL